MSSVPEKSHDFFLFQFNCPEIRVAPKRGYWQTSRHLMLTPGQRWRTIHLQDHQAAREGADTEVTFTNDRGATKTGPGVQADK